MSNNAGDSIPKGRPFFQEAFELAARWYVFVFLNVYGLGKIVGGQFYHPGRIPPEVAATPLGEAAAFDLAWTFMGHSFAYILFIGLVEMLGAWLLLWERTKLIGVAVLLPVMVNILVFDVIFLDRYGALASASIYTALLFVVAGCNQEKVWRSIGALTSKIDSPRPPLRHRATLAVLALAMMALLFALDQTLVNVFGHGKG